MGGSHPKLSKAAEEKALEVFKKMDADGSKTIDKEEVLAFWQGKYPKLNASALFGSVDKNGDGQIQEEEWMEFWRTVRSAGHTEEEIIEELDNIMKGGTWVEWSKVPKFKKEAGSKS